mgnify:CR=1 FL=1
MFNIVRAVCYLRGFRQFLRGNQTMDTTTAAQTNRLRSTGTMAALVAVVAIFSTGCTAAEIDQFLTLLKIIGFFI